MTQGVQRVGLGIFAVCFTAFVVVACGDDDGSEDAGDRDGSIEDGGASGRDGGSSNTGGTGGGGADAGEMDSGERDAGEVDSGERDAGEIDSGDADASSPTEDNLDELVAAVCDWEFRCCDAGERAFRLSPFATDAATCAARLIFEMRESNAVANPYVAGPAAPGAILGALGYVVDLSRVEINADGVRECTEHWEQRACNDAPDPSARCDGPPAADPCALTNLFRPKLQLGDECTIALTQGGIYNDVECLEGSTCLPGNHADNASDEPTCVRRSLADEPCIDDDDCDFDLFCSSTGTCVEKGEAGGGCAFKDPLAPQPDEEAIPCRAGLTCNPLTFQCVEPCTLGFTCATHGGDGDLACPAGSSCAPLEVAGGTTLFRVCAELGTTAESRCNSDADCEAARYCEGSVCQADKSPGSACAGQNECAAGLYCDIADLGYCVNNLSSTTACTDDVECGPASAGCLNQGTAGFACRDSLLANGAECGDNAACASHRCELAAPDATVATCVAGAVAGADCDTIPSDGQALSCGPGLRCYGETGGAASGTCVARANPGTSCENPDGDPDDAMCANGSTCVRQWSLDLCTDAPIAEANGGTGVTCDGT